MKNHVVKAVAAVEKSDADRRDEARELRDGGAEGVNAHSLLLNCHGISLK